MIPVMRRSLTKWFQGAGSETRKGKSFSKSRNGGEEPARCEGTGKGLVRGEAASGEQPVGDCSDGLGEPLAVPGLISGGVGSGGPEDVGVEPELSCGLGGAVALEPSSMMVAFRSVEAIDEVAELVIVLDDSRRVIPRVRPIGQQPELTASVVSRSRCDWRRRHWAALRRTIVSTKARSCSGCEMSNLPPRKPISNLRWIDWTRSIESTWGLRSGPRRTRNGDSYFRLVVAGQFGQRRSVTAPGATTRSVKDGKNLIHGIYSIFYETIPSQHREVLA